MTLLSSSVGHQRTYVKTHAHHIYVKAFLYCNTLAYAREGSQVRIYSSIYISNEIQAGVEQE